MRWSVAFKTAFKIAVALIVTGFIGFALISIGIGLVTTGIADSTLEEGSSRRETVGFAIAAVGGVWVFLTSTAVFVKYFAEAAHRLSEPVLSDVHARVIYVEQMLPETSQPWRYSPPPPAEEPTPAWRDTSPPAPGDWG